jgi:hypothetical protein
MRRTILSIALVALLGACGGTAPALPPKSSMTVDFSKMKKDALTSQSNWLAGVFRVGLLDLWVGAGLAPEVATFAAAYDQEPKLVGGNWEWSYAVNEGLVNATATLTGKVTAGSVAWEMRINGMVGTQQFNDFLWFDGTSQATSGFWQLYSLTGKLVRIDWNVTSAATDLKFTDNTGTATDGHTLDYNVAGDLATVTYDLTAPSKGVVSWSISTAAGYVDAADYTGHENVKECWDNLLNDTTCP